MQLISILKIHSHFKIHNSNLWKLIYRKLGKIMAKDDENSFYWGNKERPVLKEVHRQHIY